jgi:CubicO group peptidase (beta-lactamase class C family)
MGTAAGIHGECDARFARLREVFERSFAEDRETGASPAVVLDGRPVVDLWGGHADAARTRAWERDTIVNLYSTTKGWTALCAHVLVDRGELDLDAPVARHWPEFARAGKGAIPVRQLLCHQAGLPGIRRKVEVEDVYDWERMTTLLAEEEPWWPPGTRHGYHALTFGWLVGEVVRRVAGRSLGAFFRDEIAGPLGLDLHVGLGPEHDARVAELIPIPLDQQAGSPLFANRESLGAKVLSNPRIHPKQTRTRAWRAAEIPAANGHGNARGLARLYGALSRGGEIDGVRVIREAALAEAAREHTVGPDAVLVFPMHWGAGFIVNGQRVIYGPNARSFGHSGYGGSFGFADPDARLGMGYAMNRMGNAVAGDLRTLDLIRAAYANL